MATTTYHGSQAFRDAFLAQIRWHEEQDALVKGTYGTVVRLYEEQDALVKGTHGTVVSEKFRGCAIGCSLASLNALHDLPIDYQTDHHERLAKGLGWPLWLVYLEDTIFERLPQTEALTWPRRLVEAVPIGVEIPDRVLARMLWWTLADDRYGVRHATDRKDVRGWIDTVAEALDAVACGTCTADQRKAAAWAAREAWAARATWKAWEAWAAGAAWAARAAWAAWEAWEARTAREAREAETRHGFWPAFSEYVLEQLRAVRSA